MFGRSEMRWLLLLAMSACVVPAPDLGKDADDTDVATDDTDVDTTPSTTGIRVLVLDDGGSGTQVVPALEAAGHEVVQSKRYTAWNGTNPDLSDIDVVVWLQGRIWEDGLPGVGDDKLVEHVLDGRGLVRTEKASLASTLPPSLVIDLGLPVTYDIGEIEGTEWQVTARNSPLVEGLATKWDETGTSTEVEAKAEATVVIETQGDVPLVSWIDDNGGRVVHINHDMTGTTQTLSSNMQKLLGNAVTFAADL